MKRYKPYFEESNKEIKSKQDIVDFIKHQLNIELPNDPTNRLNKKRNILYTTIPDASQTTYHVLDTLRKKGLRVEKHIGDSYWIWVKN